MHSQLIIILWGFYINWQFFFRKVSKFSHQKEGLIINIVYFMRVWSHFLKNLKMMIKKDRSKLWLSEFLWKEVILCTNCSRPAPNVLKLCFLKKNTLFLKKINFLLFYRVKQVSKMAISHVPCSTYQILRESSTMLYVPIRSITVTPFCSFFLAVFNQVHFLATLCLIPY